MTPSVAMAHLQSQKVSCVRTIWLARKQDKVELGSVVLKKLVAQRSPLHETMERSDECVLTKY